MPRLIRLPAGLGIGQEQVGCRPRLFRHAGEPAFLPVEQPERLGIRLVGGEVKPLERLDPGRRLESGPVQDALGQGQLRLGVPLGRRLPVPKLGARPALVFSKLLLGSGGQAVGDQLVGIEQRAEVVLGQGQAGNILPELRHGLFTLEPDDAPGIGGPHVKPQRLAVQTGHLPALGVGQQHALFVKETEIGVRLRIALGGCPAKPERGLLVRLGLELLRVGAAILPPVKVPLGVKHAQIVLRSGVAVDVVGVVWARAGSAKKPIGSKAEVLLHVTADVAGIFFALGVDDAKIVLGSHVIAREKPALGQLGRPTPGEKINRQDRGIAGGQHDLQRAVGVRQALRLERRRVAEPELRQAALPAVRVEKPDEVNRAVALGPAEHG